MRDEAPNDSGGVGRRTHDRVSLLAAVLGMSSLLALPFATVSRSRIATGRSVSAYEAISPGLLLVLLLPWVVLAIFAWWSRQGRVWPTARSLVAAAAFLALMWASGRAAEAAVGELGAFARYSLGGAVWGAGFSALVVIVSSRRQLERWPLLNIAVLSLAPLGTLLLIISGGLSSLGVAAEYRNVRNRFWSAVVQHLGYAAGAILVATLVGVTLGILAYRNRRLVGPVFGIISALQTIPGLAMVGILVVPLATLANRAPLLREFGIGGLGWAPLVLALTLYALLAIVRNTFAGMVSVPAETVEAGHGMGMTDRQVVRKVQLPLASPIIFSGIRTASQQTVANATLGAFVAAGGLGPFIFLGLAQQATDLVLLGSLTLVVLALSVDVVMRYVQQLLTPRRSRRRQTP